jgi:aldehyde:ferredoxin oxidoreductase
LPLAEVISAVTGWDFSAAEAITAGRRSQTIRQAFNIREGLSGKEFNLPDRMARPPEMGPYAGRDIDFNALKTSYYTALGWDVETGRPSEACLDQLGLKELVGNL